jgi:hypothetical protein
VDQWQPEFFLKDRRNVETFDNLHDLRLYDWRVVASRTTTMAKAAEGGGGLFGLFGAVRRRA